MALAAKTTHQLEKQKLFSEIRHYVACKHDVPEHLDWETLVRVYELLQGGDK
jgi:hypothetical protein